MEIHVSHHEGYVLASTSGSIDETAGELFREYLHPLIGQRGTYLIIDLSKSGRVTSPGISHMVLLSADANTRGSHVILAAPSPFIANVLNVTKLRNFFTVEETLEAAVNRVVNE